MEIENALGGRTAIKFEEIPMGAVFNPTDFGPDESPLMRTEDGAVNLSDGQTYEEDYWSEDTEFYLIDAKVVVLGSR